MESETNFGRWNCKLEPGKGPLGETGAIRSKGQRTKA